MGEFFNSIKEELDGTDDNPYDVDTVPMVGTTFGGDFNGNTGSVHAAQTKLNALGAQPQLKVDGIYGNATKSALTSFQASKGLNQTGNLDEQTMGFLGISIPPELVPIKISTIVAALKQAGQEAGYTLSPALLSLMIGQLRGAEGAYPGVHSSLGGTNNMGAAQVTQGLMTAKNGMEGWGAFAHKDTSPNARTAANPQGAYIGWYWIAPSPLEAARHWLIDNWWGKALAQGNPQNATDYSAILYRGGYYEGNHAGDTQKDPNSAAGAQNVADYAAAVSRGVATAAEMAVPPDDPAKITVDPSQFATLDARGITEAMFNTAKTGGIGSAWAYLLPDTWADMQSMNGVKWFGPPPPGSGGGNIFSRAVAAVKAHPVATVVATVSALAFLGLVSTGVQMQSRAPSGKVLALKRSPA